MSGFAASVKNGKWHKVTTEPRDFRTPVQSECGVTFEPFNVTEGLPTSWMKTAWCRKCFTAADRAGKVLP